MYASQLLFNFRHPTTRPWHKNLNLSANQCETAPQFEADEEGNWKLKERDMDVFFVGEESHLSEVPATEMTFWSEMPTKNDSESDTLAFISDLIHYYENIHTSLTILKKLENNILD